jgi:hypothetical protein
MKVIVEITREFEVDEDAILSEPTFDPPPSEVSVEEKRDWLQESFYELLFDFRTSEKDHVNGKYITLVDEDSYTDFRWNR